MAICRQVCPYNTLDGCKVKEYGGVCQLTNEECRASRPHIKARIEQIIDEYNFPQLERSEIVYTIADVLTDRLLPEKDGTENG